MHHFEKKCTKIINISKKAHNLAVLTENFRINSLNGINGSLQTL